jgi:prefoldin subunit 5
MSEDLTKRLPPGDKDEILTAIKNLDSRINNLDTRRGSLDTRLGSLDTRLGSLEQKVDERLYDTRPMWHKLEADITQLQAGVERLEKGQVELRDHILDFGRAVRDVNRHQIVINDVVRKIQLDFHN